MIQSKNKLLLLLISAFVVSLSSCYSKIENNNSPSISKEVDFKSGATVNLKISDLKEFTTKSTSSTPEATVSDVKSITAFLSTNPTDPFATGSNPFGDGVSISKNYTGSSIISFMNVPVGGPYYAVIAAFDDVTGSITKNNITEGNTNITSTDNKWYVSGNSVMVLPSRNLAFSNTSTALDINLVLRKPFPNSITSAVTISDGTAIAVTPAPSIN
jgi:hypothetical protein